MSIYRVAMLSAVALGVSLALGAPAFAVQANWGEEFGAPLITNGAGLYDNNIAGVNVSAFRTTNPPSATNSTWGASPAGNSRGDGIMAKAPVADVSGGMYTLIPGFATGTGMVVHNGPAAAPSNDPFGGIAGAGAVGAFTFETRAKMNVIPDNLAPAANWPIYFQNRGNDGLRFHLSIGKNNANEPYVAAGGGTSEFAIGPTFASLALDPLEWHIYRIGYSGGLSGEFSLWVDGTLAGSNFPGGVTASNGNRGFALRQEASNKSMSIDYLRVARGSVLDINTPLTPVPEPASFALLGLGGLAALFFLRRRR